MGVEVNETSPALTRSTPEIATNHIVHTNEDLDICAVQHTVEYSMNARRLNGRHGTQILQSKNARHQHITNCLQPKQKTSVPLAQNCAKSTIIITSLIPQQPPCTNNAKTKHNKHHCQQGFTSHRAKTNNEFVFLQEERFGQGTQNPHQEDQTWQFHQRCGHGVLLP